MCSYRLYRLEQLNWTNYLIVHAYVCGLYICRIQSQEPERWPQMSELYRITNSKSWPVYTSVIMARYYYNQDKTRSDLDCLFVWWYLMPHSTIFQLYRGRSDLDKFDDDTGSIDETRWQIQEMSIILFWCCDGWK